MLLSGVEELFIVDINIDHQIESMGQRYYWNDAMKKRYGGLGDGDKGLWEWVRVDEAEILGIDQLHRYHSLRDFVDFKRAAKGSAADYIRHREKQCEEELAKLRDLFVAKVGVLPWTIPPVKIIHVGSRPMIEVILERRDHYWRELEDADGWNEKRQKHVPRQNVER